MTFRLLILLLLLGVLGLIVRENLLERPRELQTTTDGRVEMCLTCHTREKLDPAHDSRTLGCSPCHLGDPLAFDREKAHGGLVRNPGDLRVVERTCGIDGCHGQDPAKVKKSLMATNRGILATLLYYWGEAPDQNGDFSVEQLLESGETSLALDYFRKLCATCHLWKQRGDLPGFFGEKGGGCTACHYTLPAGGPEAAGILGQVEPAATAGDIVAGRRPHPLISKKIPQANCLRCHNRSGRIGLSYIGVFESEGYGAPFEKGGPSLKRLPGERFYLELPADIHHQKGMVCIDCHTRDEVMGDNNSYAHYEQALEIRCVSCHAAAPGLTAKNQPLPQIGREESGHVLTSKLDGKKHPLKPPKPETCAYPGHERLSCESCHSTWVPQCYGCHAKLDKRDTDLDKLTLKETPGWWEEGRSYLRYEQPTLAVWDNEIVVVTPGCQDIVTVIDEAGQVTESFNRLTMAAINPHTTQAKGRSCRDCHASPKTVGLGEGTVWPAEGEYRFDAAGRGVRSTAGETVALDAYVAIDGTPLQHSSRPDLRPFNREEIARILRVGRCLECHVEPLDPIYKGSFREKRCPVFEEE